MQVVLLDILWHFFQYFPLGSNHEYRVGKGFVLLIKRLLQENKLEKYKRSSQIVSLYLLNGQDLVYEFPYFRNNPEPIFPDHL